MNNIVIVIAEWMAGGISSFFLLLVLFGIQSRVCIPETDD
jgi:hypothetical protein